MPKTQNKKTKWWTISAKNDKAEILLYDEIDDLFGTSAKQFVTELNELGDVKTLDVRINSPGGSVFQGVAIYNALKRHKAHVNVIIDGVALSMASGIAMAGDTVTMVDNGLFMLHDAHAISIGGAGEHRKTAEMLEKTSAALVTAYADKSGKDAAEIEELMADETWMSAEEAYDYGFVDAITETKQMAASFDVDSISVPSRLRGAFNTLFQEPETMANDQPAGAPQPATLQELEALNAGSADFVLDCLREQHTVEGAKDALIVKLRADVTNLESIVADNATNALRPEQRAQGTSTPAQPEPTPAAATPQPEPEPVTTVAAEPVGNQPLTSSAPNDAAQLQPFGGNPIAFFNRAMAEVKAELKQNNPHPPVAEIIGTVQQRYPGLYDAIEAIKSK